MVATCRLNGMSAQEAYDHTGLMIDSRLERLDECVAALPYVDAQVATYVQGMKNVLVSNVHWSFRGQRYFGSRNEEVKKTRVIDVLAEPEYLNQARVAATAAATAKSRPQHQRIDSVLGLATKVSDSKDETTPDNHLETSDATYASASLASSEDVAPIKGYRGSDGVLNGIHLDPSVVASSANEMNRARIFCEIRHRFAESLIWIRMQ